MAEPVVVTCCAAPDKDMARKTQVMESKKCRRHSKIEERGTHSIDRMVERKKHRKETRSWKGSTWTRTNKDFFLHRWAGYIARSGTDTQTAMASRTGGLQWWREARRKHSSKWNGVHPRRFSCWRWEAQIAEFKEYKDGMSADVTKNAGWLAAAQDRKRWKRKKQSISRG